MKKKAIVFFVLVVLSALFAGTGLFAQDKRPRNLADAKIPIDKAYNYEHCWITGYTGPTNNPAANGPIIDNKGKRLPMYISHPKMFNGSEIVSAINAIETGPDQTVEISVTTEMKLIFWGGALKPRLLVIQPNSLLNFSSSGGKHSFVLKKGSIKEDKDFKMARDTDNYMEFYSSAADSWMAPATIGVIDKVLRSPGDTKEQLANKIIGAFQAQNGAFSVLSSLAPIWLMPADFAVDMTKNMMKASLAYGLWYCYTGKKLTGAELKSDLYILLDNDDVKSTLLAVLKASGETLDTIDDTIEISQKIGKFLAKTNRGAATFAKLAKDNGKIAAKITAQASKAADAIPVASNVIGVATDLTDMQIYANQVKYYYGLMSSPIIAFNSNGGSAPSPASKTVNINDFYGELPVVSRDGYRFDGWYTAVTGGTKIMDVSKVTVTGGQTLYARWIGRSVTVDFNSNGGSAPSPSYRNVTVGSAYGALPTVTRAGYNFSGWHTQASGGTNTLVGISTIVAATGDHKLYARWSVETGGVTTISFEPNGGTAPSSLSKQLSPGSAYGDLPTVSRGGYKFDGWYTAATGGNKIESTSRFDGSVKKLYAHWINPNDITVTFNSNGGGAPNPASKTVTVYFDYGTLPAVTRDGYKFEGWYTAASGGTKVEGTTKVSNQSSHQLFARWTANSVTLSFNANASGSGISNPSGKTVTFDSAYGTLPIVTRDGYKFDGWYTAASGGTKVEGTTKVTNKSTHSLYAHWTPDTSAPAAAKTVTVTFHRNGGTSGSIPKITAASNSTVTLPTPPTRPDYTFTGWNTKENGSGTAFTASTRVTADIEVHAQWKADAPKTLTLTFNANGGSAPNPSTRQLSAGDRIGPLPTVTRNGYTFDGWYTAASGGTRLTADHSYSGSYTTVYAQWTANAPATPKTITITYDPNGGTLVGSATKQVTIGSPIGSSPAVTRSGYTLDGWFNAPTGGGKISSSDLISGNYTTFYAQWTKRAAAPIIGGNLPH